MKVEQIYTIVNSITSEVTGKTDIVAEDLSNIVDVGTEIFSGTDVDNYVKKLVDHIGKVVFVDRDYRGIAPKVLMDAWEYGSVVEKIQMDLPTAVENPTWNLTNGQSYDPNVFYQPTMTAKFFNNKSTFEIPMSFTEVQIKESFSNVTQLNAFMSMIYSMIARAMTVRTDSMIQRTINNMIAQTFANDFSGVSDNNYSNSTSTRAVNLLKGYNAMSGTTLTASQAITTPDFIRYASYQMGLYVDRLRGLSTLFNCGGKERFTPSDLLHIVLLSDFTKGADMYLYSDTFHNELVKLPNYESVPYWQGSGQTYEFAKTSAINVTTSGSESNKTVNVGGIVGVMFDRDALGVTNYNERVTSNFNAKAEFYNNFYKYDCGYFNDLNENFVVFFLA